MISLSNATPATTRTRTCAKHGEFAANVIELLGRTIATQCPTCQSDAKARETALEQRLKDEARGRRIEALAQRSGVPKRFQGCSFANYEVTNEGQGRALRIAQAYAESWAQVKERGTCLIFSGEPGTGKTHLASAIVHAVIQQGSSALFCTVSDALRSIRRAYGDASMSELDALNTLVEPRLLILDEVGMAYDTDHSKTLIFDLMNKRYEAMRPTILLTNLDAAALRQHLGDRITDRLREGGGKLVSFNWSSHRA